MLATKQSHAVLRPLLPSLGNLIHDRVEKVRLATVQMLLQIKKTPGIKYYRVVPVDHLILRLAEEGERSPTNSVASALTSLMLNSYFPQGPNISGVQQINRTLTFLTNDPEAARVFYANVASHLPVSLVAKLTAMLLRCLHAAVENDQQREREAEQTSKSNSGRKRVQFRDSSNAGDDDDEKEDEKGNGDAGEGISASDTALMANLADTICVLWESIEDELEADEECNKFLVDEFSGSTLTNALTHFERKAAMAESEGTDARTIVQEECYRTCAAILRTAGRIPAKAVEGLVPYIASVLESLTDTDDSRTSQNVTAHIALLCLWDMSEKVASSLAASIESAFPSVQGSIFGSPLSDPRKRRSARTMKESDLRVPELPARMALKVLGDILRGSDPSSVAAREFILCSNTASRLIEQALEKGTKCAERVLAGDPVRVFCEKSAVPPS
jgi:condensin-2 complex subunit G2